VYVYSCSSACSTNEVDDNVIITTRMKMLKKYQFEPRDCSHISYHKDARISQAKQYKRFKFTVATGR
jgi:hypothetical protein